MRIFNWAGSIFEYLRRPPQVSVANANHEILEEIGFHLISSANDKIDAGLEPQEAQEIALNRFGDVQLVVQECKEVSNVRHVILHRFHQLATTVLLCSTATMTLLLVNGGKNRIQSSAIAKNLSSATGYSVEATSGDIVGVVQGEHGPIAAANVLAVVKTWPPNGFRQQSYMTTTGPDGSFEIEDVYAPTFEYEVQVAAIAEGHSLNSEYKSSSTGVLKPFNFRLKKGAPFKLKFESGDGEPVEGVCAFPFRRIESDGKQHNVYFSSADPIVQKSSPSGDVSMPYFFPGERATVFVRFPNSEWQTRELVVPDDERVVVMKQTLTSTKAGKL